MKRLILSACLAIAGVCWSSDASACTGISLRASDGSNVLARTVEWAATQMQCGYVVVPRGHEQQSYTPSGENGMKYKALYGYVGIYTEYEPFVVEGVNEAGFSVGLFFFPRYGQYAPYVPSQNDKTICDMQFVSWALSQFESIAQVKDAISKVNLVTLNHKIGAVHWRLTDPDGKMVVLEVVNGVPHFYDNQLGVLTNAPGFQWHMTNLSNYINLRPGTEDDYNLTKSTVLSSLGHGSSMLGLPGDFTSPSRFVRAAFFKATAPIAHTGFDAVTQAFHILNNFDLPIGVQLPANKVPKGMQSATQFTAVVDQSSMRFYYRTATNSNIRCIDLMSIDFHKVKFQVHPLDNTDRQPVEMIKIK